MEDIIDDVAYDLKMAVKDNNYFRRVLSTTKHMQLVAMSLGSGGISQEKHADSDQFFKVEEGKIKITVNNMFQYVLSPGQSIIVKAGQSHIVEVLNDMGQVGTPNAHAKIYVIYAPPHHPPNTKELYDNGKTA